jgi:hypothetical protein
MNKAGRAVAAIVLGTGHVPARNAHRNRSRAGAAKEIRRLIP